MFETIDISQLDLAGLGRLRLICEAMSREAVASAHHADYDMLAGRIRTQERQLELQEQQEREEQAVVKIHLAEKEEAARRDIQRQTEVALRLQAVFRGNQTRKKNVLGLLREEQQQRQQEQLQRAEAERLRLAAEAEAAKRATQVASGRGALNRVVNEHATTLRFTPAMPRTAPVISEDVLSDVGRLEDEYCSLDTEYKSFNKDQKKKARGRSVASELVKTRAELDAILLNMATTVRAALSQQRNAVTVALPVWFRQEGEPVACGNFFYPGAGTVRYGGDANGVGARQVTMHPNRSLVHVRDEVTPMGTLATAQAYLDDSLRAVREVLGQIGARHRNGATHDFSIAGTTDTGHAVTWNVIYQLLNGQEQIIHLDSGYEWSWWRPTGQRGICPRCGVRQTSGTHRNRTSGNRTCTAPS